MMETKHFTYVETEAVEAVLRVMQVLREAGDEKGALRELEHFVVTLKEKVLIPLDEVVSKESGKNDGFRWIVKSRYQQFQLV